MSRTGPRYTTHEEDKALVVKALGGNNLAYNILAEKYKPILYTLIKRRLHYLSEEDMEDMVMVIMGRAFVSLKTYNPSVSKFFTWMVSCGHNYINSLPRKKKVVTGIGYADSNQNVELIRDTENIEDDMDKKNTFKLLRSLIDKLPQEISQVYKLKFFKDKTNSEIAEIVGIHETHVYYRVKKGREILKKWLEQRGLFE